MSIYAFPIESATYFGTMVYKDFLTPDEVDLVLSNAENEPTWQGGIVATEDDQFNPNVNEEVRRVEISTVWVNTDNIWLFDKLSAAVQDANKHYNYDLTGFMEHMQLLRYTEPKDGKSGGFYNWHQDVGLGQLNTRKLTCIIQLTDPSEYEGCDVEVMGSGSISKQKGTLTIFPSFTHHMVTELTKGHRESIVAWVNGHPFR